MQCSLCRQSDHFKTVFNYTKPPVGETPFDIDGHYMRRILQCQSCFHYVSSHEMDLTDLYTGNYVDATYGDKMHRTYQKIMQLPPEQSDNVARVLRIVDFTKDRCGASAKVLDVGSGLGVFPARMKEAGWLTTALDPDNRAVAHIEQTVGVQTVHADFMSHIGEVRYDLLTFNKVLEHVKDPITMLAHANHFLTHQGLVYIELPDGEMAEMAGADREEFYIDHWHVFSLSSMSLLAKRAGFDVIDMARIYEPSGKYTLYAFLQPESVSKAQINQRLHKQDTLCHA